MGTNFAVTAVTSACAQDLSVSNTDIARTHRSLGANMLATRLKHRHSS